MIELIDTDLWLRFIGGKEPNHPGDAANRD